MCSHIIKNSSRQWVISEQSGERQVFVVLDAESELLSLVEVSNFLGQLVRGPFAGFYVL